MVSFEQNYSWLDRMFHRVAFSTPAVQLTAADIEKSIYGRRFTRVEIERPVFITSLPRAGTTLLLDLLGSVPGLATYSYRDMPFILAPLLWETLSKGFRKPAQLAERAHADGMTVGYDSHEAFEEILWRAFWPSRFTDDGIALWADNEAAAEFNELLRSQMQRIIAVRSNGHGADRRYLSKNNANIARIGLLKRLFPDSAILIPFREPVEQAGSLLRQHLRFLRIHHEDPFARKYMEDVGHLEFGTLHRPIRFDGMERVRERYRPDRIEYWLGYWLAAFTHIRRYADHVVLVSYERLCQTGSEGLRKLAAHLGIAGQDVERFAAAELHPPRAHGAGSEAEKHLIENANRLYGELSAMSVV